MATIDIVVPVYRERPDVLRKTVEDLRAVASAERRHQVRIVVVNDGSPPEFDYSETAALSLVTLLKLPENRGYGAAIKAAIRHSAADWIAITDADGTYPNAEFPRLFDRLEFGDMVVGARVTNVRNIPAIRRFPKYLLTRFASYVAGRSIPDLNSGMRIFGRERAFEFWSYYPDGFSFTSTITLGYLATGYTIDYVPIDYLPRQGKSTMQPIQDTRRFFQTVTKMGLFFAPRRIFAPFTLALFAAGVGKGIRDYALQGAIGDLSQTLMQTAVEIFLAGLLAELIVKKR